MLKRLDGSIVQTVVGGQTIRFFVTNPFDAVMQFHHQGVFYEREELSIIQRHLTKGRVFVDIGAMVGNHSVFISRFTACSKVIVFEPNKVAFSVLKINLLLNECSNVDTQHLGIALAARKVRLKGETTDNNNLGHTCYFDDASGDVLGIDGDSLLFDEPIEFIKIDVEGMEIDILSGLERTIKRWQPKLFVEVWDNKLHLFFDWCERQSYACAERYQRYDGIQNLLIAPRPSAISNAKNGAENCRLQTTLEALKHHPDDGTRWRDLGQGYRDAGRPVEAALAFARRGEMGGEAEEAWYARWQRARCLREINDEAGFVQAALAAFRERPQRAEPLHDLATYYLATKRAAPAALYAEAAMAIGTPEGDTISVDVALYETGLRHHFTAAASWSQDAAQKERGRRVCEWLALSRGVPPSLRAMARYNLGWFAVEAKSLMPSLELRPLNVIALGNFHPANLSICRNGDQLIVMVRSVNWILKDARWYVLQGPHPYRSFLSLLTLGDDLRVISSAYVHEPDNMPPPQFSDDLGFADPRPFIWRGGLWCLSLVRQLNARGRSEMVLSRVSQVEPGRFVMSDWRVVPSGMPEREEKNWMPQIVGEELRFIYTIDPTRILADTGAVLHSQNPPIAGDNFRGGSQAVELDNGWLIVIHEAEIVNGGRRYFHRFIWLDPGNTPSRLSRRFYFRHVGVEFVAGMAWHPDGRRLVISFSVDDREPFLAIVDANDVRALLLDVDEHRLASNQAVITGRAILERLRAGEIPFEPRDALEQEGI